MIIRKGHNFFEYKGAGGKLLGILDLSTKTFHKSIIGSRDTLDTPLAIKIEFLVMPHLSRHECQRIVILDKETGITYTAHFIIFCKNSFEESNGKYLALTMPFWVAGDNPQGRLSI